MLYNPPAFKVEDTAILHADIAASGFAMLVTNGAAGPLISHVPLLLNAAQGPHGTLLGHMARANPHWQAGDFSVDAAAVFSGPDAYITPAWYASKQEHGRVVPTWNYAVVHARGRLSFFDEPERVLAAVTALTERHEARRAEPWAVSDAPARFVESQLRAIVGFELEITHLEGKHKVSQNRPREDVEGVIRGLGAAGETRMQARVEQAASKRP